MSASASAGGGGGSFSLLVDDSAGAEVKPAGTPRPKWIKVAVLWLISLGIIGGLLAASLVLVLRIQEEHHDCGLSLSPLTLPGNVVPSHYTLTMRPSIPESFSGTVDIDVAVLSSTRCIVLNTEDLAIASAALNTATKTTTLLRAVSFASRSIAPSVISYNATLTHSYLKFAEPVQPGEYTLSIAFSGKLRDDMTGFYRSEFTDGTGTKRWMAATQFEQVSARRAFPCFDDIKMKATFDVTIVVPDPKMELTVLGNMPDASRTRDGDVLTVKFQRTNKMSTYLLAFIVGPMESASLKADGITYTVWTVPGKLADAELALQTAPNCTRWIGDFVRIPYSSFMKKMDLAAIPDFEAGAMENWGLLTFRDRALLAPAATASLEDKAYVVYVTCHEIAHQWFGDLITPASWEHLWLKEGFATYFGFAGANSMMPEWHFWDRFITGEIMPALDDNASPTTRSHLTPVTTKAALDGLYDSISYNRGGALLHMLRNSLGDDAFRNGLNQYLKKWSYSSPQTSDLWESLAAASARPHLPDYMATWMNVPGYPLVTVEVAPNDRNSSLVLSQSRFVALRTPVNHTKPAVEKEGEMMHHARSTTTTTTPTTPTSPLPLMAGADGTPVWWIPLTYHTDLTTDTKLVEFNERRAQVSAGASGYRWWKGNAYCTGFYRVNYSPELWSALGSAINGGSAKAELGVPSDRFGVVSDALALARASMLNTTVALDLVAQLLEEDSVLVWTPVLQNLRDLAGVLQYDGVYEGMQTFAQLILTAPILRLGYEESDKDTYDDHALRPMILLSAIDFDVASVISDLAAMYREFAANEQQHPLSPDLRTAAYVAYVKSGGRPEFQAMFERFKKSMDNANERLRCLRAMAATPVMDRIAFVLDLIKTDYVRLQDLRSVIYYVEMNSYGRMLAWQWFKDNWHWLHDRLGEESVRLGQIILRLTRYFSTEAQLADVDAFTVEHRSAGQAELLALARALITTNIAWREANAKSLEAYFKSLV